VTDHASVVAIGLAVPVELFVEPAESEREREREKMSENFCPTT
jgi:hypothetical protein